MMLAIKVTSSQLRRLERNLSGRKAKTETDAILMAFTRECGTLEDWDGNREAWQAALGAFTLGWRAHARQRLRKPPRRQAAGGEAVTDS